MRNLTACPSCGQPTDLTGANLYRPFCSRRCRLVDLGGWLNEERRIADDGRTNGLSTTRQNQC